MDYLKEIVTESVKLGVAQALETLGVTSGEISQRTAIKTYGKWFRDAEGSGRLHPSRIDNGKNGTRHYRVVDIQALRTADLVRAELQLRN